jgi:hypothetical protein
MHRRQVHVLATLTAVAGIVAACATLQVPRAVPSYPNQEILSTRVEEIEMGVRPIRSEAEYLQYFDDNLPAIGIAAIWMEVSNSRTRSVSMQPASWVLRIGDRDFHSMTVSEVFTRYYRQRRIRMYSVRNDREARQDLEKMALGDAPIAPAAQRRGFVFFRIDPQMASDWDHRATLVARDVLLDGGSKTVLRIALFHAGT